MPYDITTFDLRMFFLMIPEETRTPSDYSTFTEMARVAFSVRNCSAIPAPGWLADVAFNWRSEQYRWIYHWPDQTYLGTRCINVGRDYKALQWCIFLQHPAPIISLLTDDRLTRRWHCIFSYVRYMASINPFNRTNIFLRSGGIVEFHRVLFPGQIQSNSCLFVQALPAPWYEAAT